MKRYGDASCMACKGGGRTQSRAAASKGSTGGDVRAHGRARARRPAAAHAARGPAERGRGRAVHHAGAVLLEQAVGGHGLAAHAQARRPLEQRVQRERAACARAAARLRRSAGVRAALHAAGAPLPRLGAWCAYEQQELEVVRGLQAAAPRQVRCVSGGFWTVLVTSVHTLPIVVGVQHDERILYYLRSSRMQA